MRFHRFKQPTYTNAPTLGAAPAFVSFHGVQYNFFNVISEGVGAGGSAFLGDYKPSGGQTGTYAVAYGEDATSSNANRGLKAVIENTDTLDDLFHRDLAVPVRTAAVAAGADIPSIVLPADTFVGDAGGYPLDVLFSVLDSEGEEILNGDDKVRVASITGATVGSGFSAGNVTLVLSHDIPTGVTYYVAYSTLSNLAELPTDALVALGVRASEEVAADVKRMIGHIVGQPGAWDVNPLFNLFDLGRGGLNGFYRRSTTGVQFSSDINVTATTYDTPGAGAEVLADGRAIASIMQRSYAGYTSTLRYQDPLQALFRAEEDGAPTGAMGRIGFVSLTNGADPTGATDPSVGSFMAFDRLGAGGFTDIIEGSNADLSIDPGASQAMIIDLGANHTMGTGEYSNAIRMGRDLIRIRLPDTIDAIPTLGDREITLRVIGLPSATSLQVIGIDGRLPTQLETLAAPITVVVRAYYSPRVLFPTGAGSQRYASDSGVYNANEAVKDGSIEFFGPKANTLAEAALFTEATAKFWGNTAQNPLEWGRETGAGITQRNGFLTAIGDVHGRQFYGGSVEASNVVHGRVVIEGARYTNDYSKTPRLYLTYTGAASASAFFLEWDSDRTFPRTGLDTERTNSLGTTGARFPRTVFVSIASAVNITVRTYLPTRDVTVGDAVEMVLLLQPTGGATIDINFDDWSFTNGGITYAGCGFNQSGVAYSFNSNTRTLRHIKFVCFYTGVHPISGAIVAYWGLEVAYTHTISAPLGEFFMGLTAGTNTGAIVQTINTPGGNVSMNQLV